MCIRDRYLMHPEAMKHKASLWDGDYGTSRHITDVHWEGDITPEELIDVADRITTEWQTIDLELDPAHPSYGQVFHLERPSQNALEDASELSIAQAVSYTHLRAHETVLD